MQSLNVMRGIDETIEIGVLWIREIDVSDDIEIVQEFSPLGG